MRWPPTPARPGAGDGLGSPRTFPRPRPVLGSAGARGGGHGRGPRSSQSAEETCRRPSHCDPRDGPGKVCPGKKMGGSGSGGSRGRSRVARGLRAAPTHSSLRPPPPSRAPARALGLGIPRGAGPAGDGAGGFGRGGWRAARPGQGRPGGETGSGGGGQGASAPGQSRPGGRRAPACARGAEAEGRHPLPGVGGGPGEAPGRGRGRGVPAGG